MPRRNRNALRRNPAVPKVVSGRLGRKAAAGGKSAVDKAKAKTGVGAKFKSGLESRLARALEELAIEYQYEPKSFDYQVPAQKYTPDFYISDTYYVETKGKFTDQDRKKMLAVMEQNPDLRLVMVFSNPNQKIRKGAKLSCKDWCVKKGIPCTGIAEFEAYLKEQSADYL